MCCMRVVTFKNSFIGLSLQRLEAAAVLIDGLHLRIFVPRQWGLPWKRLVLHFPEIPATTMSCLPFPSNGGAAQVPPFAVSLSSTWSWMYRQHRESFASCTPTVWKLNERLQLCSRRCNERSCLFYKFIIGVALRRITELSRSLAASHPRRHPAHKALLLFYFLPQFSKWCFFIRAFALVSLVLQLKGVESGMKFDRRIMKNFLPYYYKLWT